MNPLLVLAVPIAISTLSVMPAAPAVKDGLEAKDVKIKETTYNQTWHEMTVATAKGYCVLPSWGLRLTDTNSSSSDEADPTFIYRLADKDGKTTLEKTRFTFDAKAGTLKVGRHVSVELSEVARSQGVVVWGYKEGFNIVLVARGVDGGTESAHPDDKTGAGAFPFVGSDGCPYAMARLDASAAKSGAIAQLTGALPTRGKGKDAVTPKFVVDASLSKLSRDPEPVLSVRVRMRE